jgi:hypothetical protein
VAPSLAKNWAAQRQTAAQAQQQRQKTKTKQQM